MSDTHPLDDMPVCTPPRSWVLDDGTTIREGSRVQHAPTGDRGGQALTHPSDLAIEPPGSRCDK